MFGIDALEDVEHIELLGFRRDAQRRGLGANGAAQATGRDRKGGGKSALSSMRSDGSLPQMRGVMRFNGH